jgi:ribosomal protein S18 acetylase RimI-like enzyme
MSDSELSIRLLDWNQPYDCEALLALTQNYALHPMGMGKPLPAEIADELIPRLQAVPNARVFLAWDGDTPLGMATCFIGFSTFKARELINVHDLAVHSEHQGRGIGRKLLQHVQQYAIENGFCAVTLEVRNDNTNARTLYHHLGFKELGNPLPEDYLLFGKWTAPN